MGVVPQLLQVVDERRQASLALGVTAFLARIAIYSLYTVPDGYNAANIIAQVLRGIAAYGLVMAAIGYGRRYLNKQGRSYGFQRYWQN